MGPTGSGKTEICLTFPPDRFEIINCDSRQVYRGMIIGTAAPDDHERSVITHHCTQFLSPAERMNAGIFTQCAHHAVKEIIKKNKIPVIAGGTGFYFKAFRTGLFEADVTPEIKEYIQSLTREERLNLLKEKDPDSLMQPPYLEFGQGRIHYNDDYRISRALEITLATGIPWSIHWQRSSENEEKSPYQITGWFLDPEDQGRENYRRRLLLRAEKMIEKGFVSEAVRIREEYGACPALSTLGYPEALSAAEGKIAQEDLAQILANLHFQYGKKQISWFKKELSLRRVGLQELKETLKKQY